MTGVFTPWDGIGLGMRQSWRHSLPLDRPQGGLVRGQPLPDAFGSLSAIAPCIALLATSLWACPTLLAIPAFQS